VAVTAPRHPDGAAAPPGGLLTALDHVVIAVRDLAAATNTYGALYGRRPSWRGSHPGWGTANTLFRLANSYVELLAPAGEGPFADALRAHLDAQGEGPYALAFATADADACAATLRGRGIAAAAPLEGGGRDTVSGAERAWRHVFLPTADTRGVPLFVIEHRSPASALPPAAVAGEGAAAVDGIDHVVVMTADPEAAIALYRDRLGLRLAFDRLFDDRGLRLLFFRLAGITVELAAPLGAREGPDRFWGISYRVDDVDAARARVAAAGFDVSAVRPGHKPGTRVCTVRREPHGVATLLIGAA
jgi:catechol 2,3-dioxygenase-like lactoylglutathione lyase family enzyme